MGVVLDLYRLKLKVFYGSLRASRSSLFLFIVFSVGMLPTAFGLFAGVSLFLEGGVSLIAFTDTVAAFVSGFTALFLVSTYRGFKVFEYEQGFVLTSPITPVQYLLAGLLFDVTTFLVFFNVLPVFFIIAALSLALNLPSLALILFSALFYILFLAFLKNSLAIAAAVYDGKALKLTLGTLLSLLLFPALGLFTQVPVSYSMLPYPVTFLAQCILGALTNHLPVNAFAGLTLYFLASLTVFLFSSRRNFFPFTEPIPLMSPFDTSARMQAMKVGKTLKFSSRASLGLTLDLDSRSLLGFLMKKEFIRMARDGSLFSTLLFYLILSMITMFSVSKGGPMPVWLVILMLYSIIVPSMLTSMWRVVEMDGLWIPLTSGMNLDYFVKAILYDLTLIAFTVPAAFITILTFIANIDPLMPLVLVASVSMIGCSTHLYTVVRFLGRKHRATPWMMIGWVSLLITALLLTPTYTFSVLSLMWDLSLPINAGLSLILIIYSALVFIWLSRATRKRALRIEL